MKAPRSPFLCSLLMTFLVAGGAVADQQEYKSSSASNRQNLDCSERAGSFEPFTLGWLVDGNPSVEGGEQHVRCVTRVRDGGSGRKGVKVRLDAELLNLNGDVITDLGSKTGKTDKDGNRVLEFDVDGRAPDGQNYLVSVEGNYSTRKKIDEADTTCTAYDGVPCQGDNETLCLLNDDRFRVEVDWRSGGQSGRGQVVSSGFDTGSFYFFNPNSADLVVQLLDACSNNDHFWVFAEAFTNVEYDLTVTDTVTGSSRVYETSPAFEPILDTSAFATCP
jgi:hypothetical protein